MFFVYVWVARHRTTHTLPLVQQAMPMAKAGAVPSAMVRKPYSDTEMCGVNTLSIRWYPFSRVR